MNLTEFDLDGVITAPQPMELKVKSRNFEANRNLPNNQNKDLKSQSPQTLVKQEVRSISVHKELEKILKPLDALYPIEQRLDLGPYVHWRGNAAEPMHRWLRYREAYSDLPPLSHTKSMEQSPLILENGGYEDHTIYRRADHRIPQTG